MDKRLSERGQGLIEPETGPRARYYELRRSLRRALDPKDATGYLAFGNADEGRRPYLSSEHIREAAKYAIDNPGTDIVYTPSEGRLEVREAIAEKCERENDFEVDPEKEVHVTVGTQMGIFCTMQCLLNPGDKVLIPDPEYGSYIGLIKYAGGVPVRFPMKEGEDGQTRFDVEAMEKAASPDIKLFAFTNPCNPGGYLYTKSDLEAIADLAERNDFLVFADDLYEKLVYDGRKHISFASIPGMKDRTITIMGTSKTESMQIFRIGYVIAPEGIMRCISRLAGTILIRSPYISQKALLAFLTEKKEFSGKRIEFHQECRDLVWRELNKIDGIRCNKPMGTSYAFPNHRALNPSSYDFVTDLLEKGLVALNAGSMYGPEVAEGHVRFCFASPQERLKEGLRRIKIACEQM